MIRGAIESPADHSPEELRSAYEELLAETVRAVGVDAAADGTELARDRLAAIADGETPAVTVEEAAAILALAEDRPSADAIEAEARDVLLIGMSTAVLDVEAVAAGIDDAMDPKEIQQKVEGRHPMTVAEYARLQSYIESQKR
jgi:hypothetical protein